VQVQTPTKPGRGAVGNRNKRELRHKPRNAQQHKNQLVTNMLFSFVAANSAKWNRGSSAIVAIFCIAHFEIKRGSTDLGCDRGLFLRKIMSFPKRDCWKPESWRPFCTAPANAGFRCLAFLLNHCRIRVGVKKENTMTSAEFTCNSAKITLVKPMQKTLHVEINEEDLGERPES
jgi:hypothetical protein